MIRWVIFLFLTAEGARDLQESPLGSAQSCASGSDPSHLSDSSCLTVMYAHSCLAKPVKECSCLASWASSSAASASVCRVTSRRACETKARPQSSEATLWRRAADGGRSLTAEALMKLVSVLLSDGSTFPATTSSEPLKYLSKRLWVTSDTESSGN